MWPVIVRESLKPLSHTESIFKISRGSKEALYEVRVKP